MSEITDLYTLACLYFHTPYTNDMSFAFVYADKMSQKVETRSDKRKSKGDGESSSVPPAQPRPAQHGPAPRSLVDGYGPQELLNSPPDCFPSSLKEEQLDAISRSFGIDRALMVLPGAYAI